MAAEERLPRQTTECHGVNKEAAEEEKPPRTGETKGDGEPE